MFQTESEAYAMLLCSHLRQMTERLRQLSAEQWDWTPAPAAATARTLAAHAWQWLVCDRQHIAEPDAALHPPIPDAPTDVAAMCDLLADETRLWREMLLSMSSEELDQPRKQFNKYGFPNVRAIVCHMVQNTIYKHGQFSTLYFALGLDGDEPYAAPFPNAIYAAMRDGTLDDE